MTSPAQEKIPARDPPHRPAAPADCLGVLDAVGVWSDALLPFSYFLSIFCIPLAEVYLNALI